MSEKRFDLRTFAIIAGAAVLGACWAAFNLWQAGDARDESVYRQLIWAVFATPFVTFFGWAWARPGERWRAAYVCFIIYFFAILISARIERFVLGEALANGSQHALYFRLTLLLDLLACLGIALHRARSVDTIRPPEESVARQSSSNS